MVSVDRSVEVRPLREGRQCVPCREDETVSAEACLD
jgi:hypothetical protein